jgi:hypothetical protein
MNSIVRRSACALAGALFLFPMSAAAQEDEPAPEIRYITVTRTNVPLGEDRQKVLEMYERVMTPQNRMDPNVLSYSVATHIWGSNSNDIVIVAEYASWAAINEACEACDEWFETNFPEDSPQRAEIDALGDVFTRYQSGHSDEIYTVNMNRAKR